MTNQSFVPWDDNCADALRQVFSSRVNAAILMAVATCQGMM